MFICIKAQVRCAQTGAEEKSPVHFCAQARAVVVCLGVSRAQFRSSI